jgi:RNA polymerase sigma-70 factor (ECF subfamily)
VRKSLDTKKSVSPAAGDLGRMSTTPVSLLERLRQPGQAKTWDRFAELYTPFLFYWARRLGAGPQDAEDLVQDVMAALVQKLPEFRYDRHKSFRGWLRTIITNLWRDRLRHAAAPAGFTEAELSGLASGDGLEALWDEEHRRHLASRALGLMRAEFQPTTWKACWEHVAEGRLAAEVAGELGISENAVYIASSRVLRRLRQELDGLLD